MKKPSKTSDRSSSFDGKEAARELYGGPTEAKATGAGDAGVCNAAASAFTEAHRLGQRFPDQIEALLTSLRTAKVDPLLRHELFFDPPALWSAAQTSRASEDYRAHLRQRFGVGVPGAVVSAFAEAHRLAQKYPDQIEALAAGLRAGTTEKQRERAAGGNAR